MLARLFLPAVLAAVTLSAPAGAATYNFRADLQPEISGQTGSGSLQAVFDDLLHTLWLSVHFSGVSAPTTVAHIHAPTAAPNTGTVGVAVTPVTLPGFPADVTAGTYAISLDLTDPVIYTAGFLALGGGTAAGAEALLLSSMLAERSYFNIHTIAFPAGEIRGFLALVPVPAGLPLLLGGFGLLALVRRRR